MGRYVIVLSAKVWRLMMFYQQCRLCTPEKAPALARILGGLRMLPAPFLMHSPQQSPLGIGRRGSRQSICWLFQTCHSFQVCGAVGYVQPYQRLYYSPWWLHPPVGHCLSSHVALARIRVVAFHMTGAIGSHAGFSAGFCGCPSVVRFGWPWYAPWVWSICMPVTQVGNLPPDVLDLFCKWEQRWLISSHEGPGQFGRSVWRLSSVTGLWPLLSSWGPLGWTDKGQLPCGV